MRKPQQPVNQSLHNLKQRPAQDGARDNHASKNSLNSIKQKYQCGEYHVDYEALADALLEEYPEFVD